MIITTKKLRLMKTCISQIERKLKVCTYVVAEVLDQEIGLLDFIHSSD